MNDTFDGSKSLSNVLKRTHKEHYFSNKKKLRGKKKKQTKKKKSSYHLSINSSYIYFAHPKTFYSK